MKKNKKNRKFKLQQEKSEKTNTKIAISTEKNEYSDQNVINSETHDQHPRQEEHGQPAEIRRNFFSWAGANFLTKLLGYVRDAAVVAAFGGGALTDAYYAAFRIANLFRRTVGEGGLNAVFIPGYAVERNKGGANAVEFADRFFTAMSYGSAVAVILGILLCWPITFAAAAGLRSSPEYFRLATIITAIFAPHFLFVNISAFFTALLNSKGRFFIAAIVPGIVSVSVLIVLALYAMGTFGGTDNGTVVIIMASAASLSGLVQVAILLPQLKKEDFRLRLARIRDTLPVFPLVLAAIPSTAVLAQDQIALLIDSAFASFMQEGSITAIYNSARLTNFPISMFAAAAAVTALPHLSRFAAEKNNIAFNAHLYRAVFTSQIMLLPSAAGLAAIAFPICSILFQHGNFTFEQTEMTAKALIYSCLALPFSGLIKVMASAMYAAGSKKTPSTIIGIQLLINAVLCLVFMKKTEMGVSGLLIATAISSAISAATFIIIMKIRTGFRMLNLAMAKIVLCASAAGGFAWLLAEWLESSMAIAMTAIPAAIIIYFASLITLKVSELKLLTGTIVKRR